MHRPNGPMWLALAAGCLIALLAVACSGSDDKPKAASPAASGEAANLADNFSRLKSFRAVIGSGDSPAALQGTIEYQAPDRVHVTAGTGTVSQEVLCIGDAFYAKPQGSDWQTVPSAAASCRANLGPANPDAIAASLKVVANIGPLKKGAEDSVNGKKCTVYTQMLPSGVEFGTCVADGLPLRIINKAAQGSVTITFSDFDKPLDLKAPIQPRADSVGALLAGARNVSG